MSIFGCPTVVGLNALADERARQPGQCVGACMDQEGACGRQHLRRNAREGVRSAGSFATPGPRTDRAVALSSPVGSSGKCPARKLIGLPIRRRGRAPESRRRQATGITGSALPATSRPTMPTWSAMSRRLRRRSPDMSPVCRSATIRPCAKEPAQLDPGRQLAALFEGGADRGSLCLGDDEHPRSMATRPSTGTPC
jgi:hypothetical protein